MKYRILPHGGEKISIIGMGSSVIGAKPESEIIETVRTAVDNGINFFDMAGGHAAIFEAYGKALKGIRDKVYLSVQHLGRAACSRSDTRSSLWYPRYVGGYGGRTLRMRSVAASASNSL